MGNNNYCPPGELSGYAAGQTATSAIDIRCIRRSESMLFCAIESMAYAGFLFSSREVFYNYNWMQAAMPRQPWKSRLAGGRWGWGGDIPPFFLEGERGLRHFFRLRKKIRTRGRVSSCTHDRPLWQLASEEEKIRIQMGSVWNTPPPRTHMIRINNNK